MTLYNRANQALGKCRADVERNGERVAKSPRPSWPSTTRADFGQPATGYQIIGVAAYAQTGTATQSAVCCATPPRHSPSSDASASSPARKRRRQFKRTCQTTNT